MIVYYLIFLSLGAATSELITRFFNMRAYLELYFRRKVVKTRIHHAYLGLIALITFILNYIDFTMFFVGIAVHDMAYEIAKAIKR